MRCGVYSVHRSGHYAQPELNKMQNLSVIIAVMITDSLILLVGVALAILVPFSAHSCRLSLVGCVLRSMLLASSLGTAQHARF